MLEMIRENDIFLILKSNISRKYADLQMSEVYVMGGVSWAMCPGLYNKGGICPGDIFPESDWSRGMCPGDVPTCNKCPFVCGERGCPRTLSLNLYIEMEC